MEPQDPNGTQNTQTDSQQTEEFTPGTVLSASSEPVVPASPKPAKSKKPFVIIAVLLVLALLVVNTYWFLLKDDTDSASNTSQQEQLAEEQETALPEGFELYENAEEEISFIYPSEWGEVTIAPGPEEEMAHLTAGTEQVITFSNNQSVSAGVMSPDWTHDEQAGHGGLLYPGATSLEAAKQAAESLDADQIYVNTDTQLAYIMECVMFCDVKHPILVYTVSLPAGGKYSAIQFHQAGDEFGQEFYSTNEADEPYLDEEKVAQADLTQLFPQSDPRFTTLQTIADYMTQ